VRLKEKRCGNKKDNDFDFQANVYDNKKARELLTSRGSMPPRKKHSVLC